MEHQPQNHAASLELRSVCKSYGHVEVLKNIGLRIDIGEFVTILGASGSGKTTLLKIIAGFERPNSGHVLVSGEDLTASSPSSRDIGMVFQNYALFPHMTVRENVAFPLKMRGLSKAEIREKTDSVLGMVALGAFLDRYPNELSGGQQQRVALARAIVFEPKLLLLDEPFSALDRHLRETMQVEIRALQRRLGLTTIFITHDQEEALIMSDRIAIMAAGEVCQFGTPTEIYHYPASASVAEFIGDSNILDGVVGERGGRAVFETRGGLTIQLAENMAMAGRRERRRLLLRPECIRLSPYSAAVTSKAALRGRVAECTFVGASILYHVAIDGAEDLTVRSVGAGVDDIYRVGDRVSLHIPCNAGHVLAAEGV